MKIAIPVLFLSLLLAPHPAAASGGPLRDTFRLGVVNERQDRPDFAIEQYSDLHAYLAKQLAAEGIGVGKLVIAQNVNELAELVGRNSVDGIIEGVFPTLHIERRTQALEPTLLAWRKKQRIYHSVFFVRRNDTARSLVDLRGRKLVLETPRSTSAFALPLAELLLGGFDVRPDGSRSSRPGSIHYVFAGSEVNQAYWVLHGKGDAGAFNDGDWHRLPGQLRHELRVIHRTKPILRWLFSFQRQTPEKTRHAVVNVLEHMHGNEEGKKALESAENIARFERLSEADRGMLADWRKIEPRLEAFR